MAKVTDLVYAIYGKDVSASRTLKGVGKNADSVSDSFKKFGKVAATSLLAVGAAATTLAAQSIKNAIEDEKSQRRLQIALKNTVNATQEQTASVEDYIAKTQARYGVVDDKLRPSLQRLLTATKDITKAQELQTLALNISAGTGKDLGTVSNALGKAYGGNLASLQRLGLGLDASIIKSKDFGKAQAELDKTFAGQAEGAADSLEGKFKRLTIAVDETKEQIGYALLPYVEKLAKYLTDTVVPNVKAFTDGLTGVENKSGDALTSIHKLGEQTRGFFKYLSDNKDFLGNMGKLIAAIFIGSKAYVAVRAMAGALALLRGAFAATTAVAAVTAGAEAAATGGLSLVAALPAIGAIATTFGVLGMLAAWTNQANGETPEQVQRGKQTGMKQTGSDQAQRERWTELHSPESAQAGNGMIWFNGYKQFEKPYMHSVKNQPLVGLQTTVPGVPRTGYRALGGAVARGASYIVGERGPELLTMGASNGFVTPNNRLGGLGGTTVVVNVAGSVIHEKDLAVTVRDNIAQLMRRRGLNPAILGV